MNRILTTYSASGQPFTSPTSLDHLQDAMYQGFRETLKGIIGASFDASRAYAVWGCDYDAAGPSLTAGTIFFQNEIFAFYGWAPGASCGPGTVPALKISTTWAASDPLAYADGSSHNTHRIRTMVAVCAASGSTDVCDLSALVRIPNPNMLVTTVATDVTTAAPTFNFGVGGVYKYTGLGAGPTITLDTSNAVAGTTFEVYTSGTSGTVISLSSTVSVVLIGGTASLTLAVTGDVYMKMKFYDAPSPADRYILIEVQNWS